MTIAAPELVRTTRGYELLLDPEDEVLTKKLRESGCWEEPVAQAIEAWLEPGWTFLDLGAHVGYFSLIAAARGAKVIAVEANLDYADMLFHNLKRHGLEAEIYATAVSDQPGPTFLAQDERFHNHPSARYLHGAEGIPVEAVRLLDILGERRPEFIKLDIEGLEYGVLRDSPEVLDQAKVIVFEVGRAMCDRYGVPVADVIELMREHGFEVTYLNGQPLDYQVSYMNVLEYTNLLARKAAAEPARTASILLCAYRSMSIDAVESLMAMRDRGWGYRIGRADALIQRVRSRIVTRWYRHSIDDVFLMVDDDVVFAPEDAERVVRLAREKRGIACGAYPVKDGTHMALQTLPGKWVKYPPNQLPRPDVEPVEIMWPATGFMAVHRDVIRAMVDSGELPLCGAGDDAMYPFFDTFWITDEKSGNSLYLSEDYAFGERARRLGFSCWVDPAIILFHMGEYAYHVHNMVASATVRHEEEAI